MNLALLACQEPLSLERRRRLIQVHLLACSTQHANAGRPVLHHSQAKRRSWPVCPGYSPS